MNFLGHRVHTIIVGFPMGLLRTAVAFDILFLATDNSTWAVVSYWIIAGGIVGGLIAAMSGVIDWLRIPSDTRAKSTGRSHGLVMSLAVGLFAASWLLRYFNVPEEPQVFPVALAFAGGALTVVGGWLGGELVQRLGVGVHRGAHVNAPSSLGGDAERDARTRRQGRRSSAVPSGRQDSY